MTHNKGFTVAVAAAAVNLALYTSAAVAAPISPEMAANMQKDEQVEKIEVTGSHIRRTDMEGPSPIASLDASDIANSGVTDLISLFTKLPISGQGTFSTQGNSSDDTANGGSSVSLRGLGADSTLILVNGRRVSVSPFAKGIQTAFVDINNIPLAAIKRVDILKDGASATYGSDAIAGVINIILKDDFEGFEVSAKYGDTADGGGEEQNFSMIWGNSSDKANHTFIMDYYTREEIMYSDRAYSRSANQDALHPGIGAIDFRSSSGIPGTIELFNDRSQRIPDTFGNDVCPADQIVGTLCRYDYAPHMTMYPDAERFSFNYMGNYEISDSVKAFAELNGQNSKSTIRGAGSPSFGELFMAGDNVNHPFADDPDHAFHGQDLTMRRRMVDIGNREKQVDTDYYRAIVGIEGELGDWNYEVAYSYIKSESVERGTDGFPNIIRLQESIDNGSFDPFEPSQNSQEVLDYIETNTARVGKSTNKSFDATFSGPIAQWGDNDIMLAVGAEYREESISDNPDDQFLRGEIFGTEATQANGERDSTSIFAEMSLPVMDTLELQVAVRHEDYSDFGTTTDPKLAFLWNPMDNLSVRGSWGTAFRAPSLHQLGLGRTDESPTLVDTVRCNAVGLSCDPREYTAVFEGNPDLEPEESSSYNLGVIYEITDDLSFSLDYYNYDIENIIDSDTQFVFSQFGNDPSVVERLPPTVTGDPGEATTIYDGFQNIGDLDTSGLDLDVNYNLETGVGDFRFGYVLNYVLDFAEYRPKLNDDGSVSPEKRLKTEEGEFEQPEIRWTASVSWMADDMAASFAANYIGEFDGSEDAGFGDRTVDSMMTVDATYSYMGIENTTLTIGATNLLNEEPPFSHHDFMGYANGVHSGQGRFLYVQGTYQF